MSDCEAGCKSYDGGERKHHKDCRHYAESLSKMYDDQSTRITEQAAAIDRLREALKTYQHVFCEGDCALDDKMTNPDCSGCIARAALGEQS